MPAIVTPVMVAVVFLGRTIIVMTQLKPDAFTIRWATPDDAMFVAWGVCCALHREPDDAFLTLMANVCAQEDVLYSYRHALIACVDGLPVGLCLC